MRLAVLGCSAGPRGRGAAAEGAAAAHPALDHVCHALTEEPQQLLLPRARPIGPPAQPSHLRPRAAHASAAPRRAARHGRHARRARARRRTLLGVQCKLDEARWQRRRRAPARTARALAARAARLLLLRVTCRPGCRLRFPCQRQRLVEDLCGVSD